MQQKPSAFDFGVVIAFIAPGFVAFHAASYHMPTADAWIAAASRTDQGVGVFLFVLLASLSLGLVVSGIRALAVDKLLCSSVLMGAAIPQYNINWAGVDEQSLSIVITLRDNYYRYYQFYANTAVAVIIWLIARANAATSPLSCWHYVVATGVLIALLWSSHDSLLRYVNAIRIIFPDSSQERV